MSGKHEGNRKPIELSDFIYVLYPLVPLGWWVALARLHGRILVAIRRGAARAVRENLTRFFRANGAAGRGKKAALRFFQLQQVRALLLTLTQRMDLKQMEALFKFEKLELLDRAVASGKGAILLLSHLNSLGGFVAVIMLRRMGYDVRVAIPVYRDAWAPSYFRRLLYRFGKRPESILESLGAFTCQFNIRPIVRALKEGAIVVQTGDGWHSAGFVDVDFLDHRVPLTTGVMSIAKMTGTMIVPLFVLGRAPALRFVITDPFRIEGRDQLEERIATYAALLDTHVRQNVLAWQHWEIPNTIETMKSWKNKALEERYEIS